MCSACVPLLSSCLPCGVFVRWWALCWCVGVGVGVGVGVFVVYWRGLVVCVVVWLLCVAVVCLFVCCCCSWGRFVFFGCVYKKHSPWYCAFCGRFPRNSIYLKLIIQGTQIYNNHVCCGSNCDRVRRGNEYMIDLFTSFLQGGGRNKYPVKDVVSQVSFQNQQILHGLF